MRSELDDASKKAVIPAAGLGTRFLPATKAMPKEMLPIVDKPTIQYIIEEAIESGIEDILIITGKGKRAIEDHFDSVPELEANLISKNKSELLYLVEETTNINIHFIRQSKPKGLGDAILQAKAFVGNEPFVVMLGDDIVQADVPCTRQLIEHMKSRIVRSLVCNLFQKKIHIVTESLIQVRASQSNYIR